MSPPTAANEVGLVMVHGIGEQGRFEHLNAHIRGVIQGLRRGGATVTTEIMSAPFGAFQSMQDAWSLGAEPSVRLHVAQNGAVMRINIHEVWWADVNERYAVSKQARFWKWGLSIWRFTPFYDPPAATSDSMLPANYATKEEAAGAVLWARVRLFALGCFFLITSLTLGLFTVVSKRLLNIDALKLVQIFVNYLSSVKLYSQLFREGVPPDQGGADFLDNIGIPPRFSIRRRMIRTIADVACKEYGRWYVMAHSQGSVVAFNGLMEPAFGWPGYLDEARWTALEAKGMAGPADPKTSLPAGTEMPPRPVWIGPRSIVYRTRVFAGFRGMLTYGCPLEKFAAIWPATVATCREPAFNPAAKWLNVFDPLDSVSGRMVRWPTEAPECCPKPFNIGYASSNVLLLGHIKYLDCPVAIDGRKADLKADGRLADGVALWLRTGSADGIEQPEGPRFFLPTGKRARRRNTSSWVQWVAAFIAGDASGAVVLLMILWSLGYVRWPMAWLDWLGLFVGFAALSALVTWLVGMLFPPGRLSYKPSAAPIVNIRFVPIASPDPKPPGPA